MRKFLTLLSLVMILHDQAIAQNDSDFITEELVLTSELLNEERQLTVYRPAKVVGPLSTIYLLDGEWNFEVTKGILDLFIRWSRIPNNLVLVSIHNQGKRTLDMTPIEDDARYPGSGGAVKFLEFFETELVPYVEQQIGECSDRLLIGHSFGGLFGLYALSEKPDLFDGIVAISPSTWYGDNYLMSEPYREKVSSIENDKFLFISTGEFDGGNIDSNKEYYDWVQENNAELDLHYAKYDGRNHFTNVLTSTDEGISRYYPGHELETWAPSRGLLAPRWRVFAPAGAWYREHPVPVEVESDACLVADARQGGVSAFATLVRRHAGAARNVAFRILRDEGDADEAVQEAFTKAHTHLCSFREEAQFGTWLKRIVANQALMKLRSRNRRPEISLEAMFPAFQADGHHESAVAAFPASLGDERFARRDAVRQAIARLPENYREIIMLRCVQELDTEESANFLQISKSAVKLRLHRAHQALRSLLDEDFGGER